MTENTLDMNKKTDSKYGGNKKVKWYRKKSVRIIAGVMAVLLVITTVGYAVLRSRENSIYNEIAQSDDALRMKSQEKAENISIADSGDSFERYEELVIAIDTEDYKKATELANELMALETDELMRTELQELLVKLYFNTGRYQDSVDAADKCFEMEGETSAIIYYVNGLSYIQLQDYDKATDNLIKAKELNYEEREALDLQLAIAAYSADNYEKAADCAEEYLNSNVTEDVNLCRYIAALSEINLGNYEKSIGYLDEILAEEKDSELYYYRGINNMALENYPDAVEDFKQCKEMGKEDTDVYYDLGICQISEGDIEAGVENLNIVIQKNDRQELTTAASNILTVVAGGDGYEG